MDETASNVPKDVFNLLEGKDGQTRWIKIGQAFTNRDGSINAILDVLPRDGKIQIRERRASKTNPNNERIPQ
jgi:hypothetical protein